LLKLLTKSVIETALAEEMTDHLGYEKHDPAGVGAENIRNGSRSKTVISGNSGPVEIDVPRDRAGTFEPQIVKKRQRRLGEVDEIVLSLYAKGLTTGEISAHFAEIYGASVSKQTVSRIIDRVVEEMQAWATRPLDEVARSPPPMRSERDEPPKTWSRPLNGPSPSGPPSPSCASRAPCLGNDGSRPVIAGPRKCRSKPTSRHLRWWVNRPGTAWHASRTETPSHPDPPADVVEHICAMSGGRLDLEEITTVADRFLASDLTVRLTPDDQVGRRP
jgi:hypothetical protein